MPDIDVLFDTIDEIQRAHIAREQETERVRIAQQTTRVAAEIAAQNNPWQRIKNGLFFLATTCNPIYWAYLAIKSVFNSIYNFLSQPRVPTVVEPDLNQQFDITGIRQGLSRKIAVANATKRAIGGIITGQAMIISNSMALGSIASGNHTIQSGEINPADVNVPETSSSNNEYFTTARVMIAAPILYLWARTTAPIVEAGIYAVMDRARNIYRPS